MYTIADNAGSANAAIRVTAAIYCLCSLLRCGCFDSRFAVSVMLGSVISACYLGCFLVFVILGYSL